MTALAFAIGAVVCWALGYRRGYRDGLTEGHQSGRAMGFHEGAQYERDLATARAEFAVEQAEIAHLAAIFARRGAAWRN